ncbi:MAG: Asp-tRNA(Asn)/Glu-tRNA(Gln) amidotransferase subunit GatC [Deltaproteobacteria bacterium]|nr:Asp-tRNA(Asn)/Glu-tRNA(Gln) amidotransferase subunit GatC [Deltaproteobacteria bacterium]
MKISPEEVLHVAKLARLELGPEEVEKLTSQLSGILDYVEQLGELDLEAVEPMAHVHELVNAFREDVPTASLPNEAVLRNAPEAEAGCFKVPKVIET